MKNLLLALIGVLLAAGPSFASGYGVFTQGASGLGQANAVVAHPTGPSSLYFNPALMNDVQGRQFETGTTLVYADRDIALASSGNTVDSKHTTDLPSTLYYTHQANDKITSGIGLFVPFGLSSDWGGSYEGRYLGTSAEMFSMNINPAISWKVSEQWSVAAGLDLVYVDTDLRAMINQTVVGGFLPPVMGGPLGEALPDVEQQFTASGWGAGFNLGALYKITERISIGAAYRSEVDVDFDDGDVEYSHVDPRLALLFPDGKGEAEIVLPAQFVAGVATRITDGLIVEVGVRWEDWQSTDELKVDLQYPFLGETSQRIPRNWKSTWAYNIGGQYRLNEALALNFGYLYGENAVPDATFEPIIPDADVHLLTLGADYTFGAWILSGAFGYESHESRDKKNGLGDPLGTLLTTEPVSTANGTYNTTIYLVGLSLGYRF